MQIDPINLQSQIVEKLSDLADLFLFESPSVFVVSKAIRWQGARKRLGVRATKGISDIKATTRKPYRQKGTGRARQGSLCSPQFRGGAVIFGPVKRDHSFHMNKKERKLALRMVLSSRLREDKVYACDGHCPDLSTKSFISDISGKFDNWRSLRMLFVGDFDRNFLLSARSVFNIDVISVAGLNVSDMVNHHIVILKHDSIEGVLKRVLK